MFSSPVRAFSTSAALSKNVNNVTIIGAGLMGSGIAQVSAFAKLNVNLVDSNEKALAKAQKNIQASIARVAKKKHAGEEAAQKSLIDSVLSKINVSTNLSKAVASSDLVIEAIVENVDIKRKLFAEIEANTPAETLLATNTSSLKLIDIGTNLKHKERFGGLHFFNPVPVMKLLEVVRFDATSKETFESLLAYGKTVGKTTVACKDTPGFIVNRLLVPYCFEALRLAERGDASKEDIDVAMKLGAGYPMGPFELSDYVGLDTLKFIMDGWVKDHPNDATFAASESLNKLVSEGKLGRKTGEGFFKYN